MPTAMLTMDTGGFSILHNALHASGDRSLADIPTDPLF